MSVIAVFVPVRAYLSEEKDTEISDKMKLLLIFVAILVEIFCPNVSGMYGNGKVEVDKKRLTLTKRVKTVSYCVRTRLFGTQEYMVFENHRKSLIQHCE